MKGNTMPRKKQLIKEEKPFGGNNLVYIAKFQRPDTKIKKETVQTDGTGDMVIDHPYDTDRGDLIFYYDQMTNYNSYHARCIRVKTDTTVGLGMSFGSKDDTAILNRLSSINDKGQSFNEVVARWILDFYTNGNGFLEIVRSTNGFIQELYHMPSVLMQIYPRGSKYQFKYDSTEGKSVNLNKYEFGKKEIGSTVLHIMNPTQANRHYGLPDWRGAISDIELSYYANLYNQKFFINSGVPDLAIVVEGGEFDEPTKNEVISFLQSNIKGVLNAHRTLYLPVNNKDITIKFEKLAMDQKDQDGSFDKLKARTRDDIISAHGVPPRLVGIVTAGQLGGGGEVEGQLKIFQEITIAPNQSLTETKLDPIVKEMEFPTAELKFAKMDTNIQERRSEYYPNMVQAGILEVNEAREALGLEPLSDEELQPKTRDIFSDDENFMDDLEKVRKALDAS